MIYKEVFEAFERHKIRYLVVGGIATNLHGYARLTVDLDIMVDLADENLEKLVQVLDTLGFAPRVPVATRELISRDKREEWIREKGAIVFTFVDRRRPFRVIDMFLKNPIDFERAYEQKMVVEAGGVNMDVISIDDLVEMKKSTGRKRDEEDVDHLERVRSRGKQKNQ